MVAITGGDNPAVPGQDYVDLGGGLVVRDIRVHVRAEPDDEDVPGPVPGRHVVDGPKTMLVFINDAREVPAVPRARTRATPIGRGPGIAFPGSATLTIQDDDTGGTIGSVRPSTASPEDVAGGMATITLTRTGGLASGVTVRAQTGDLFAATTPPQTGAAGVDYTSTSTVVTFNAGDTTAVFTVPDHQRRRGPHGVKTVNLKIGSPLPGGTGAAPVIAAETSTAVLRIVDATQTVGFTLANFDVSEAAGTATVQIERTGDISGALTVNYATTDGTALAGVHYQTADGHRHLQRQPDRGQLHRADHRQQGRVRRQGAEPEPGRAERGHRGELRHADHQGRRRGPASSPSAPPSSWSPRAAARPRSRSSAAAAPPAARCRWRARRRPVPTPPRSPSRPPMAPPRRGSDYTAPHATVVEFGAGEFVKTVMVPITPTSSSRAPRRSS